MVGDRDRGHAFRDSRVKATVLVEAGVLATGNLTDITPALLKAEPTVLKILRSATCPPLAQDRLGGLAGVPTTFIKAMEDNARLPLRAKASTIDRALDEIADVINRMLDVDLFPWLSRGDGPTDEERHRASTIVADRLCGALSNPIIRNAQERRQLDLIGDYLTAKGYYEAKSSPSDQSINIMEPGTYSFRTNLVVGRNVRVPIDCVIQPRVMRSGKLPILIEAKSAGDFTNTNKRRKEEATKVHQLRAAFGDHIEFVLFLCGYFDVGYLGYEAAEGIDWVWEHRISDLDLLGI